MQTIFDSRKTDFDLTGGATLGFAGKSRKIDCVTPVLFEMKTISRNSYGIPGIVLMTSKSRFNRDINLCQVVCAVQHRKDISQKILCDFENQIPRQFKNIT